MKLKMSIGLFAGVVLMAGCSKEEQNTQTADVEVPAIFVTDPIPGTPVAITEARAQLKAGDEVVLTGLIMGVKHPFVEGRGVFVLGDEATLTPCDLIHADGCKTPWDVCCDPAEVRMTGTATVQVLGEDGKPIRTGLKGIEGLSELSRVTVQGVVAANSSPEAFIVNATALHIGVR